MNEYTIPTFEEWHRAEITQNGEFYPVFFFDKVSKSLSVKHPMEYPSLKELNQPKVKYVNERNPQISSVCKVVWPGTACFHFPPNFGYTFFYLSPTVVATSAHVTCPNSENQSPLGFLGANVGYADETIMMEHGDWQTLLFNGFTHAKAKDIKEFEPQNGNEITACDFAFFTTTVKSDSWLTPSPEIPNVDDLQFTSQYNREVRNVDAYSNFHKNPQGKNSMQCIL